MEIPVVPVSPEPKKRNAWKRFVIIAGIVLVLGAVVYYFICGMAYSEGTRSGILTKVSRKGFIFKTYEGELNIGGLNQGDGTIMPATVFKFSVQDKKVYEILEANQGKKVVVHYKQVMKNFFWQGESDYFIQKAELAK